MPDSVKISELAPRSAVGTDVLPAVDATFTSTIRVSASSIAAIGGGPPGDGTVTTAKIANNAVTLAKLQQIANLRLLGNVSGAPAVPGEVSATALGLAILNSADGNTVRGLIGDAYTFPDGTAAAPSVANTGNTNTGIYWPDTNTVGITTEGSLKFYVDGEGTQHSNIAEQVDGSNQPLIRPQYSCRAWVAFNGSSSTVTTINSQTTIAQRYGRTGTLYFDGWTSYNSASNGLTVDYIQDLETGYGNEMTEVATVAADGRDNYTSPSDNYHWRWTGSAWTKLGPPLSSGQKWIGRIRFKPLSNAAFGILAQGGVTSVTNTGTGEYTVTFRQSMPDTNYAVCVSSKRAGAGTTSDEVLTRNTGSCVVKHFEGSTATNTSYMAVSIFR